MQCEITDKLAAVGGIVEQSPDCISILIKKHGDEYRASMHDAPSEEPDI